MPKTICLINAGVKLATENVETIRNLKDLEDKGVRILVCGACLNFYGLSDKLQVGEVSNAFEILSNIQRGYGNSSMMKISLVIMAAGIGSRFGGKKLLTKICGKPLFTY